jgi:hypothetical protein
MPGTTGPMPDSNMRMLKDALKRRKAMQYARTGEAAKKRGEEGYNPSGTQGAKGTEATYMNPAMYKENRRGR